VKPIQAVCLTDTHCHLDFHVFDDDREAVIERARQAGVTRIVIPAIDLETAAAALTVADRYPDVLVAVGFHPNDLKGWDAHSLAALEHLAGHPKVVAIGEIGLDYYRERTPHDLQRRAFREQLELADRLHKPVIIHTRNSVDDTLALLAERRSPGTGVLHSFSGSLEQAQAAIGMGFYIGITGPVTFTNAANVQQVVQSLPLDHLLLETDAPFLAPHPLRGQRNEPAYLRYTAQKVADLHALPVERIAALTTENAARLFGWSQ